MEMHQSEVDFIANSFLRLPAPHKHIILTCPRLEDAKDIPPIMNDNRVYPWMGLPYPHQEEHARRWLMSVKAQCDSGQQHLRRALQEDCTSFPVPECPVRIIREIKLGYDPIYVGDCGITRWGFSDVLDETQRQLLKSDNQNKAAGDPTVIWTIGYYLAPSHSAQGIMSAAVGTLIRWAMVNMGVRHMRTTAMQGNDPSITVLVKNGFIVEKTLLEFALKLGEKIGLHVLDWKAPVQV